MTQYILAPDGNLVKVHDVTYTECLANKWQHIGLSWGGLQIRSVIACCLSFMFGLLLLWSSNTQDHMLRKSTRIYHGNTILVSLHLDNISVSPFENHQLSILIGL